MSGSSSAHDLFIANALTYDFSTTTFAILQLEFTCGGCWCRFESWWVHIVNGFRVEEECWWLLELYGSFACFPILYFPSFFSWNKQIIKE